MISSIDTEIEIGVDAEEKFIENVQIEELRKARMISVLNSACYHRSTQNLEELNDYADVLEEDVSNSQPRIPTKLSLFDPYKPYPHSVDFQRVVITGTDENLDDDAIFACSTLKNCLTLRNKWISSHPEAPQDKTTAVSNTQSKRLASEFRRREAPVYDVFAEEVPTAMTGYSYEMRRGVYHVSKVHIESQAHAAEKDTSNTLKRKASDMEEADSMVHDHDSEEDKTSDENGSAPDFSVLPYEDFLKDFIEVRQSYLCGICPGIC